MIMVLKGDALILECVYNSNERDNITMWGLGTRDEMCMKWIYLYIWKKCNDKNAIFFIIFSFIYYYPKIKNFEYCSSHVPHENLFKFYKDLEKYFFYKIITA